MEIYTKEEAAKIRQDTKCAATEKALALKKRKDEKEELDWFISELSEMGVFGDRE